MKRSLTTLLKILVTVAGLALVLVRIPLDSILSELGNVNWWWMLLAISLTTSSLIVRAFRWWTLLQGLGARVRYRNLVELYMVGNFFNAFLPSGFGGDAVRIAEAARDLPTNVAAGTVIVDRLTGLLTLFGLALIALPFRPESFSNEMATIVAGVALAGILGGFLLLDGKILRSLGGKLPALLSPSGSGPIARLLKAVQGCGTRTIVKALLISGLFNLMLISWWYAAGKALRLDVPYGYYILVVPLMSVALLVPSISGLGVRESIAPILFSAANLADSEAVALSLLVFVAVRFVSVSGAPVYIVRSIRARPQSSRTTGS